MNWLARFGLFGGPRKTTAGAAKERLQILLAHERANLRGPDFLPLLQRELLDVIAKYVRVDRDKVSVRLDRHGGTSTLEVNVELPFAATEMR